GPMPGGASVGAAKDAVPRSAGEDGGRARIDSQGPDVRLLAECRGAALRPVPAAVHAAVRRLAERREVERLRTPRIDGERRNLCLRRENAAGDLRPVSARVRAPEDP